MGSLLQDSFTVWRRGWLSQSVLCFVVFCPLIMLETIKVLVKSNYLDILLYLYHFIAFTGLQAAMMHLIIMFARKQSADIQEAVDVMSVKYKDIIGPQLYAGGKVLLGCLLIIPGLIWLYKYLFVPQEILFGARSTKEAMETSAQLTSGFKFKMFGFHLIFLVVSFVCVALLKLAVGPFLKSFYSINSVLVFLTLQYMLTSLVSALSLTFFSLLYLQRREDVYRHSAQMSIKALMTSLSGSNSVAVEKLLLKYKRLNQSLSSSNQNQGRLVLKR